jgi:hypothetical protein
LALVETMAPPKTRDNATIAGWLLIRTAMPAWRPRIQKGTWGVAGSTSVVPGQNRASSA